MVIRYAKVTESSADKFYVTFLGETEQSSMSYLKLKHVNINLGDMIAILEDEKCKKLIIGVV